jgi:hypothetical protein
LLIKVNSLGELQWAKTYGPELGVGVSVDAITQTVDSGFAMCHLGGFYSGNRDDGWFLKIDSQGNVALNKTITVEAGYASFFSLTQTSDRGFVLTSRGSFWNMSTFGGLLKIDENGNNIWEKIYSPASVDSVVQTVDGGFALTGIWDSSAWFAKTDSYGDIKLSKTYGYGDFRAISETKDEGFILCGFTGFGIGWLQKIDSNGNVLWQQSEGKNIGVETAKETSDGGYSVVGWIVESAGLIRYPSFARIDSNGNFMFNITYNVTDAFSIVATGDGGFALAYLNDGNLRLDKFNALSPLPNDTTTISVQPTASPFWQSELFITLTIAIVSGATVVVIVVSLLVYSKKRKQ